MKKEIMEIWVAALRSGEFKQTKHVLYDPEMKRHCCLGVLSDIALTEGVCDYQEIGSNKARYDNFKDNVLCTSVRDWAEMKTNKGKLDHLNSLVDLNDKGKTFEEIADIIEKNWEKL